MNMKMTRIVVAAVAVLGLSGLAWASTAGQRAPEHHHWHHAGPFGTFDQNALQRGLQIYQEVCASCHSLDLIHFRNLGEPGGPFGSAEFPNANDNEIVRQIAESYMIEDGPDDAGDMFERPGVSSDSFPSPFANERQARGSNGGALPPDLSLIVKARSHGADYIRSLLLGFDEEVPHDMHLAPGQHYNPYFPGGAIAMAPPLSEGIVTYADGTEATMEQMSEDIVTFLTWAGDPHMEARKQLGWMVLIFLFVFAILVYAAYRQVWANVKH
tara:strand:- start:21393 stop:22202 length:810 start_codon:yes stop_codon:yes gene_type:complete